ncbi:MAG: monofunctional biosynthetic peptidoglycan transglycosylase [Desulfobacterales bacterium]|nr:monofunctional biosynthetic peptidoglycan transglycosylase [Desulfobacterales bacterium]
MKQAKTQTRFKPGNWILKLLIKFIFLMVALTACQVFAFKYLNPPVTMNMIYEYLSHQWFQTPHVEARYEWRDMDEISPHLRRAVLASEDQRFLKHNGFDFEEIKIVLKNLARNKGIRGASTISMQAARSLFLPSSRHPVRKLAEAWYTLLIEAIWDKSRILEVYLNTVDWGTGLVGCEAASQSYFGHSAARIGPERAALMAAILPSPHKRSPVRPTPYLKKRAQQIRRQMKSMPLIN